MKKILLTTIITTAFAAISPAVAAPNSISGSTDFQVEIPEVLVLYHWDTAKLKLTSAAGNPANNSDPSEISDAALRTGTEVLGAGPYTIGGNDVDVTGSATSPIPTSSIDVTLQNAWAVRSISSGNVTLAVTIQQGDLELDGDSSKGSKAVVDDATLETSGVTAAPSVGIAPSWNATKGDIKFTLDLTGVTKAGVHKTAATAAESTDTFLLTLTGN